MHEVSVHNHGSKVILSISKHPRFQLLTTPEYLKKDLDKLPWYIPLVNGVVAILASELERAEMENVQPHLLLQKFMRHVRYMRENRRKQ